ncbi:MAG TPA: hypothetical protein VGO14_05925 [Solirubrobacteraceae bacterium]|jgi:hypothetical protein|nr:hypothetical protein [Solirubrobacteraceae bacterium]
MAKTWRLDTETKGTGAHVVPLEHPAERSGGNQELATVRLERPPRIAEQPEPLGPRTFKVLDVRSSQVLAEGTDTRATLELLADVGSVLDVRIYVWLQRAGRWRLLGLDEQRALWRFRGRAAAS